jgi:P-type Ca2+ transporter type 2C
LLAVIYVPFLQPVFKTYALSINDWLVVASLCAVPLLAGEANKLVARLLGNKAK